MGYLPLHYDTTALSQLTSGGGDAAHAGPLVSILIPMYNEERYAETCLLSILAQDFDMARVEILVVDGRSTDRSAEIVRRLAAQHPNIRLIDNPQRLQVHALNIGVRESRGLYILQMDSHCSYRSDYVKNVISSFEESGAANVAGTFQAKPGGDSLMARAIWLVQLSRFGAGASYGRHADTPARLVGRREHVTSGWSFRRDLFDRVGLFDERLVSNHDNELSARAHEAGLGVYFNPAVHAEYFSRAKLAPFIKTMFRNGFYLAPMWRIRPGTFSFLHAAPMLCLLTFALCAMSGLSCRPMQTVTKVELSGYAIADLVASCIMSFCYDWAALLILPWLFALTHASYGLGTLWGLLKLGLGGLTRGKKVASVPEESREAAGRVP